MTTVIQGIAGLKELVGQHLGYSDYLEITQERVNTFADATGDHQWIHVDPERAKAESPFGGPIAHGYPTLSLGPVLAPQVMRVEGIKMGVNYGCEKVRFPSPVPVGAKLRLGAQLTNVEDIPGGAIVRATGLTPTQGWWQAELVPLPVDEKGRLVLEFRIFPPIDDTAVNTPQSREVTVALYLSNIKLAALTEIVVQGQTNARAARR